MKKIILGMFIIVGFANAGKIFLDYTYNMDKNEISGLENIGNTMEFPKPFKIYKDEANQVFIFLDNKLKAVTVEYDDYNLKTEIENVLKNGFRLQNINFGNKDGKKSVKNVGELLIAVEDERNRSKIFNSGMRGILIFKNETNQKIIIDFKEAIIREHKDCRNCEEIDGMNVSETKRLNIYFTEIH